MKIQGRGFVDLLSLDVKIIGFILRGRDENSKKRIC